MSLLIIKNFKMKKIKLLALVLFAGALAFTSCKKDDPSGPTLSVTPTSIEAWKGDTVKFIYSISSNAKIKSLTATPNSALLSSQEVTSFSADYSVSDTMTFILPTSSLNDGDVISIVFKATDDDGDDYAKDVTVSINIKEPTAATTPMNTEKTDGVIWNIIGANKGAWDLVNDVAMSSSDTEGNKDMKNTTTTASQSPNVFEAEWTVGNGNTSTFVKDNTFDYTNATIEAATTAFNNGSATNTVSSVATGDIYIAKLRDGNYAVIKITNVVITTSDNNDKIEFSYKKQ